MLTMWLVYAALMLILGLILFGMLVGAGASCFPVGIYFAGQGPPFDDWIMDI